MKNIFKIVEKYNKYGSAYSTSKNGDIFMTIALSIENIFWKFSSFNPKIVNINVNKILLLKFIFILFQLIKANKFLSLSKLLKRNYISTTDIRNNIFSNK